jgi:hypothetical protein
MDRRLNAPAARPRGSPVRRRVAWAGLLLAVVAVHLVVTRELADRMASFDAAQAMPKRIEVAYVRTIEPEAPPVAVAAPVVPPPRRAPRAPRAPRQAAASAPTSESAAAQAAAAAALAEASAAAEREAAAREAIERERAEREQLAASEAAAAIAAAASAASAPALAAADASASAATAGAAPFEWPASTRLGYVLTGNYRGEVSGTAQVEWIRVDDRYQVNLDLVIGPQFAPIITRRMTSEGNIAASGLVPTRYDEDTHVVMRDRRRMSVVFEADAVVLANGQRRERLEGVQDTASQFIQLTYVFSIHPERLRVGASVAFPLALPRAMDNYVYEVVEAETLYSPFGPLAAFHLKPRPRPTRRPNELTVELWIAPELRYLPVRIRIEQDVATFIDLMLAGKPEMGEPTPVSSGAKGKPP